MGSPMNGRQALAVVGLVAVGLAGWIWIAQRRLADQEAADARSVEARSILRQDWTRARAQVARIQFRIVQSGLEVAQTAVQRLWKFDDESLGLRAEDGRCLDAIRRAAERTESSDKSVAAEARLCRTVLGCLGSRNSSGEYLGSEYLWAAWTESRGGGFVRENDPSSVRTPASRWYVCAWPAQRDELHKFTLVIDDAGVVCACDAGQYSGSGNGPSALAWRPARRPESEPETPSRWNGVDGNTWLAEGDPDFPK